MARNGKDQTRWDEIEIEIEWEKNKTHGSIPKGLGNKAHSVAVETITAGLLQQLRKSALVVERLAVCARVPRVVWLDGARAIEARVRRARARAAAAAETETETETETGTDTETETETGTDTETDRAPPRQTPKLTRPQHLDTTSMQLRRHIGNAVKPTGHDTEEVKLVAVINADVRVRRPHEDRVDAAVARAEVVEEPVHGVALGRVVKVAVVRVHLRLNVRGLRPRKLVDAKDAALVPDLGQSLVAFALELCKPRGLRVGRRRPWRRA